MKAVLFRTLVFTHRYLGIAIGWLLLLWCVSGMVMMYVRYPELQSAQRYTTLSTLNMSGCCVLPTSLYDADMPIAAVDIEMLAGRAVLAIRPQFGATRLIDLRDGQLLESIDTATALQVAQDYLRTSAIVARPQLLGLIDKDQWTVYGGYDDDRPLYHLALNDDEGTELYVSSINGKLVQKTTRTERFWNWLGSVPHWLYFTTLRQNTGLWAQVVIWSSVLGTFLATFGLYLGVLQLRRKSNGQLYSPYRGWKYWHHVPGLLFGVMVLSWVVSGLLSMNPWGWLETAGVGSDARNLQGTPMSWSAVQHSLAKLPRAKLPTNTLSVRTSLLGGELFYVLTTRDGAQQRLNADWNAAPLSDVAITRATGLLGVSTWSLMTEDDDYYYSHGRDQVTLPVLRVMANDAQGTRYYLDSVSGELLRKVDTNARWYRWLHSGLHRLDFKPLFRARPFWDVLMWLLLLGAALVCATGVVVRCQEFASIVLGPDSSVHEAAND